MKNVVLAAVVAAMVFGASAAGALDFTSHTMHAGGKLQAVERHDVNGDGLVDLVVSVSTGAPPEARRSVAVFLAREGAAFSGEPDFSVNAPSDACAFDLADLDDDGKAELLFFFRWSVTALSIGENGFGKPEKILDRGADAFFPDEERLPAIDLAKNWRGDAAEEIILPGDNRLSVCERGPKGWHVAETLRAPMRHHFRGAVSAGEENFGYTSNGTVIVPALSLHDFDADGDADLYAVAREEIFVFPLENGRFREKAGFRRVYRILTPAEAKAGNMNVAATVRDLDGDGHGDFVLSKFGGGLRDYQTEIRVFRGGAGGLPADPTYTLKTKGFSGSLEFPDADGDGKSDLVSPSVEITVLALIKFFTTKRVRIDYNLYRCGGASLYSLKPDYGTSVTFDLDDTGNFGVTGVPPFFGNDFDGDGKPDLLRGTDRDEIGVFLGTGGAAFADDPAWNASLTAPQQIVIDDLQRDGRADIILWYLRPEREGEIRVLIAR